MHAIILCPGPSLAMLESAPQADLIIGVNRAALRFGVGVWAALDWRSDRLPVGVSRWMKDVIGTPILLTHRDSYGQMQSEGVKWPAQVVLTEQLVTAVSSVHNWSLFSATCALVYAVWRGARRISVYGCDLVGTLDYDGAAAGGNRSEDRWCEERTVWKNVIDHLKDVAVDIVRPSSLRSVSV